MAAPDLTKLTADELRNLAIDFERNWTDRARALCELHRRAEGYALACGDRDSARDELAEMKALRDAAKSDHKEACRILRNYQTLAEERGREINALIRERDELHRRAQANDALRSAAQWVATAERDMQASMEANDGFVNAKLEQLQERCGDLRTALAAAPAAQPTPAATVTDDDAPGGDDGVEPGAPIAHLTCPGCKGALEIVHGDEVGAVSAMWVLDGDTRLTVGRYTAAPLFKVTLEKDEQPKGAEVI